MSVLVSGGAGFIGSHLVDALLGDEERVIVLDDLSTGRGENLTEALSRGADAIPAEVTDLAAVERVFEEQRPRVVFNLAAPDPLKAVLDPGLDVRITVEGTVNLLEAACRTGAEAFVLASSWLVYGEPGPEELPVGEGTALRPRTPHGQAKLAAEGYAALYGEVYGLRTLSLRLGSVYGPRQGALAGVVASLCDALVRGVEPSVPGDGRQTRDFLYIDDAVAALRAASGSDAVGELNVGSGIETSVREVAGALMRTAGRQSYETEGADGEDGDPARFALSNGRAGEALGWWPRVGLEEGLELTFRALSGNRHGKLERPQHERPTPRLGGPRRERPVRAPQQLPASGKPSAGSAERTQPEPVPEPAEPEVGVQADAEVEPGSQVEPDPQPPQRRRRMRLPL